MYYIIPDIISFKPAVWLLLFNTIITTFPLLSSAYKWSAVWIEAAVVVPYNPCYKPGSTL